ncbi:MAG: signal recognition particle-docking protein FtsY [Clostridia bacterium]
MGFFTKIIEGLKKTKAAIGHKLNQLFKRGVYDDTFFDDLEVVLLTADVGSYATELILDDLRKKLDKNKTCDPTKAQEYLREVMTELISSEKFDLNLSPMVILVSGVNGVGKTTTIGKLANLYRNKGKSVTVAAADTFRAAASEQLEIWAERANVKIVKHSDGSDPAAVVFDAIASAKSRKTDVLIIDTAGRLHNKKNLMEELKKIDRLIDREYPEANRCNMLVLDATTGQNAINQVEIFNEAIAIDGIILTKLDGTAKGGVVFAINAEMKIPVYFVGVGEGIDDLMLFDAASFIEGIL